MEYILYWPHGVTNLVFFRNCSLDDFNDLNAKNNRKSINKYFEQLRKEVPEYKNYIGINFNK